VLKKDQMWLSNVGDGKAVLIREDEAISLNVEHKADLEEERRKIESRGGLILERRLNNGMVKSRVLGTLEITRSIGDRNYKKFITCEPDIYQYTFGDSDQYVVLGSDGFWNVTITFSV
jgi:serine/threonine protein phosphatase PrpC